MQWHSAANVLFAGSITGEIYMWKVPSGDCKIFPGSGERVETAALLPDGIVQYYLNIKIRIYVPLLAQ